jgi:hypothetical protein
VLPRGLAGFCGLAPVVWCVSYGDTILAVGGHIGRQSSTAGIPVFLSLLAALPLALVGTTVGRLLARVLGPAFQTRLRRISPWASPLVLAVIAVVASRTASGPIYAAEIASRPRVILDSAQIHRRAFNASNDGITPASRMLEPLQNLDHEISWQGGSIRVAERNAFLEVEFAPVGTSARIPLRGVDYVNAVDAIVFTMESTSRPALALLITGRATGRRDLFAVVSESGSLVYLELLERPWDLSSMPLALARSTQGDVVLVGSDSGNLLAFY